ncbi:heparinase II/III family protein [Nereida sp. MMG025]|uniref:heparinase II/III family protein n=1 Tax=Nereida sp. MMG025 TaxID=2909981 RepID=UPI00351D53E5|nr:heparinase II/III family protein [Nereida sp. MMG025]
MKNSNENGSRRVRWANRYHAWRVAKTPAATGFVSTPEPRTIGTVARGRQILAGNLLFAGELVEAPNTALWDVAMPTATFEAEAHGFTWLDDLAAVGEAKAGDIAAQWVHAWIARFPPAAQPAWSPNLTGRRLIRWINNAIFVLRGQDKALSDEFYKSLSVQTEYLARRWNILAPGLPRFEALVGMIYAGLALEGMRHHVAPAMAALAADCEHLIDAGGAIETRNPEELLDILTLLTWVTQSAEDAGQDPVPQVRAAVQRIGPTLRALRHADGGLARFHGGGRGPDGKLDTALAATGHKEMSEGPTAMGFARLSAGRTSVIIDAAPPPSGVAAKRAHASTLAFELTSGRRPLIVNCGAGASFGDRWARAGRATPSHSVLCLEGLSSAQLPTTGDVLVGGPRDVQMERRRTDKAHVLEAAHDGWTRINGLTHIRALELSTDGRSLSGSDTLTTLSNEEKQRFDKALDATALQGIAYTIRFHLHPDVEASLDMAGAAVSMVLRSGEIWVFRHDGTAQLSLEPSVYLERGRVSPRATMQIVLSAKAMAYASRIRWSLAKAQETPIAVRDIERAKDLDDLKTD